MKDRLEAHEQFVLPGIPDSSVSPDYVNSVLEMTPEDVERLRKIRPKKLGIVCRRSQCKEDLHCFRPPDRDLESAPGPCRTCGAVLVDWNEMWIKELRDAPHKFELLKSEWIRHFFFHVPITPRIETYARKHGVDGLAAVAEKQLTQGKMLRFDPNWDWHQTKMLDGNIVHWARHAVACCCRRCMAYWHNIPVSTALSASDVAYFKQLVVLYIRHRMPDLEDAPVPKGALRTSAHPHTMVN
jgi:hypothetical protein